MDIQDEIDIEFCCRFGFALLACFGDEHGRFRQVNAAEKLGISNSIISDIKNFKREPSIGICKKVLQKCPYVSLEWLVTGKGTLSIGEKVAHIRKSSRLGIEEFALKMNVPARFLQGIESGQIMPSTEWFDMVYTFGQNSFYSNSIEYPSENDNELLLLLKDDPSAKLEILNILRARKAQRDASKRLLS
jgi:transcriptional regulator with XRE-family HTH domain